MVAWSTAFNDMLHKILESLQYSLAVAIAGVITETLPEKHFQELVLETLKSRRHLPICSN